MLVVGLMSGTSLDGITAALVDIEEERSSLTSLPRLRVKLLASETFAFPDGVKDELLHLSEAGAVPQLCSMNCFLGGIFAQAVLDIIAKAGCDRSEIDLIGSHGQTICHAPHGSGGSAFPRPFTLQIGEIDVIAAQTGITTVGDFRPKDIAVGGEGAPLIPYADYHLFAHHAIDRVLLNIGGIANVTHIPAGAALDRVVAFDTGPGNMLIDGFMHRISNGELSYDRDGELAAGGTIDASILERLLEHPFVMKRPPKSTGREEFGGRFLREVIAQARVRRLTDEDLLATLTAFTVESITVNCRSFLGAFAELIVSGGGALNKTIMRGLAERLAGIRVTTTQEYGLPVEAKEAVGFAILAYQTLRRRPNNVPTATGAGRPVVMGKISWGDKL